jgi:hypothetical protein
VGVDVSGSLPIPEGQHTVTITSEDARGNRSVTTRTYRLDTLPPAMSVTTPRPGSGLRYLTEIVGTAADEGSGVREVRLRLRRESDGKWWKPGSGWVANSAYLTVEGTTDWRVTSRLPGREEQSEGTYRLVGSAVDNVGRGVSITSRFVVDRQPLASLSIITPKDSATLRTLTSVSGRAADNEGGSGVASVVVELRRASDGRWWTGTQWQSEVAGLRTTNGASWKVTDALPTGANMEDGAYTVVARAEDAAGYRRAASARFRIDNHAPVALKFTSPKADAQLQTLTTVTGTATDNEGGSGIATVTVELRRASDGRWWTGTQWQSEVAGLRTTNAASWKVTDALPTGTSLPVGGYSLVGRARDRAGFELSASIRFRIVSGTP